MSGSARWAAAIGAMALMLLVVAAPAAARLRWSDCGDVEAECARVAVPLDRTGAVKGSVSLRMARFEEPSGRPTLLYLSGGPGGAGVREFGDVMFELGGLGRDYQLISYDQRGTGGSGLLRCPDARARPAAALAGGGRGVRAAARRAAGVLRHARVRGGHRGAAGGARRGEADAVRDLLRHEARARLRTRPSRPCRAAWRSTPCSIPTTPTSSASSPTARYLASAGGAVPGRLPGRERGSGRRPRPPGRAAAERAAARCRLRAARALGGRRR